MIHAPKLQLVIATHNHGKAREIQYALRSLPVRVRLLDEFPNVASVDETGVTYAENASLKALGYARQTGVCALADDSGLEVEALGGRPGVFSARFGGGQLSDSGRTDKLLRELSVYPNSERAARFVCSIALAGWQAPAQAADGSEPRLITLTEGICDGVITAEAKGEKGFGYDPVFIPVGYNETFAELPATVKNTISHRAKALAAMKVFLEQFFAST